MKTMLRGAVVICLALAATSGCKRTDRAISTTPSHAELPSFAEEYEPTLAVGVGVDGARGDRGILIVPSYEKIEPTPEERQILGEKPELELDALVLYRPPRGPQHGVSTEPYRQRTEIGGIGGAGVALDFSYQRYGTLGFAGRTFSIDLFERWVAGAGRTRHSAADAGQISDPRVDEGRARQPAEHENRHYR